MSLQNEGDGLSVGRILARLLVAEVAILRLIRERGLEDEVKKALEETDYSFHSLTDQEPLSFR